jgi:hypothetical protein
VTARGIFSAESAVTEINGAEAAGDVQDLCKTIVNVASKTPKLYEADTVRALVGVLDRFPDDARVAVEVLKALEVVACTVAASSPTCLEAGVPQAVLAALQRFGDSNDTAFQACIAVRRMADHKANKSALLEARAVEAVGAALARHPPPSTAAIEAAKALRQFRQEAKLLLDSGAVVTIVQHLRLAVDFRDKSTSDFVSQAGDLLSDLAYGGERPALTALGAYEALVGVLGAFAGSNNAFSSCVDAVRWLKPSVETDRPIADRLVELGLPQVLLSAVHTGLESKTNSTVEKALEALARLSSTGTRPADHAASIVQLGACEAVAAALQAVVARQSGMGSVASQAAGLIATWSLADPATAARVSESGVLPLWLGSVINGPAFGWGHAEAVCKAVKTLAGGGPGPSTLLLEAGAVEAVVSLMKANISKKGAESEACQALGALVTHCPDAAADKVMTTGGCEAIVVTLPPVAGSSFIENAYPAIAALTAHSGLATRLGSGGACPLVVKAVQESNVKTLPSVLATVRSLALASPENLSALTAADAPAVILAALGKNPFKSSTECKAAGDAALESLGG